VWGGGGGGACGAGGGGRPGGEHVEGDILQMLRQNLELLSEALSRETVTDTVTHGDAAMHDALKALLDAQHTVLALGAGSGDNGRGGRGQI